MDEKLESGQTEQSDHICTNKSLPYTQLEDTGRNSTISEKRIENVETSGKENNRRALDILQRLTINDYLTLLIAIGSLSVSIVSCQNAADTSDIKSAVSKLSALAADTKRAADAEASQVDDIRQICGRLCT